MVRRLLVQARPAPRRTRAGKRFVSQPSATAGTVGQDLTTRGRLGFVQPNRARARRSRRIGQRQRLGKADREYAGDLRTLVSPEDVAEAERVAERLARAMRYRLSRRR